jgi:hypothetical protein
LSGSAPSWPTTALALGQNYTFEVDGERYIGRPKDREPLLHLEAIKRLREQEGLR